MASSAGWQDGRMDLLTNAIQPYAWGSHSVIAALQGRAPSAEPEAELWMGAHPGAPSRLHRDAWSTLLEAIEADPQAELGAPVAEAFGHRLPSVVKVLVSKNTLSLEMYPT